MSAPPPEQEARTEAAAEAEAEDRAEPWRYVTPRDEDEWAERWERKAYHRD